MNKRYMSNCGGEVEVIEKINSEIVVVKFLNTGFTRQAYIDNVKAGKVKDLSLGYVAPIEPINEVWSSNSSGDFLVIQKQARSVDIMFLETGTTKRVHIENAKKGKVLDPYRRSVYGRGVLGEISKKPKWYKQASQLWRNMMKRCYSEKDSRGYYGKAFVSLRWHYLPNFIEDLPTLDGFEGWLEGYKSGEPYNLDKDTKVKGNMYYTKEFCRFLPQSVNKAYTSKTGEEIIKRLDTYLKNL
jgi:hypothetical protein